MIRTISQSVGKGGTNLANDVRTIQELLNANIQKIFPLRRLQVDGRIGPTTIGAIEEFQRRVVHMALPDGRVDPRGATINALNWTVAGQIAAGLNWPIAQNVRITTRFGVHDEAHTDHAHRGIDLAAPAGTPVLAAQSGTVLHAGVAQGFGHWIVLQHENQVTIYGHVRGIGLAAVGSRVQQGDQIAQIGHNEGHTTGDHLHFEVRDRVGGQAFDPIPMLPTR